MKTNKQTIIKHTFNNDWNGFKKNADGTFFRKKFSLASDLRFNENLMWNYNEV